MTILPKPTLIIMIKEPVPGRVKTRLGRDIGRIPATWWFRHQTRALIKRLQDPGWTCVLAVSPDAAGIKSRFWPDHIARVGQGIGDLGQRMAHVMNAPLHGPVCIVGGDIPDIQPHHIARAFRTLGSRDFVFGPAPDGGFWLVGAKRTRALPKDLFQGITWSTPQTLADTVASLNGYRIGFCDELSDVDVAADLKR